MTYYCRDCGAELKFTTHYCLKCLSNKSRVRKEKKEINFKEEFERIKSDTTSSNRANYDLLKLEYLEMLKSQPILLSELIISSTKFVRIIRQLKYEGYNIHLVKIDREKFEAIAFLDELRNEAKSKLRSIFPVLSIPKFMR